jgi:hypothetical protein
VHAGRDNLAGALAFSPADAPNGLLGCRTVLNVAGWPFQVEANGDTLHFPAVRSLYIQSCTGYGGQEWTSTTVVLQYCINLHTRTMLALVSPLSALLETMITSHDSSVHST